VPLPIPTVTDPAFVLTFAATFAILIAMPIVAGLQLPRWLSPAASMPSHGGDRGSAVSRRRIHLRDHARGWR
jgi:hypothetical protein